MSQLMFVSICTVVLAAVGFCIGFTIHGETIWVSVPTIAGAVGGFGIGCAALDVIRRWRLSKADRTTGDESRYTLSILHFGLG